jgi:hypothetical protein
MPIRHVQGAKNADSHNLLLAVALSRDSIFTPAAVCVVALNASLVYTEPSYCEIAPPSNQSDRLTVLNFGGLGSLDESGAPPDCEMQIRSTKD